MQRAPAMQRATRSASGRPLRLALLCLQALSAAAAGVTNVAGATLAFPDACDDLDCTLTLAGTEVELPTASFWTRAFDGGLPGPTLRARAGDTLRVKYVNDLKDKDNDDRSMNEMRQVNTSNLHVHGLHVSSRAAQESEIPNFKGSDLGHFTLVSADFWTSDHLSERSTAPRSR